MTNDELVFVCLQCGHGCASYEDLTSHMEDHEDQKPDIRQLRKTTVFNKNRYGAKFGRGGKKARANDDSKAEIGVQRTRMYSYPSYISIGTNSLDNIDTTWSQVECADKAVPVSTGSKVIPAKGAQKGTVKNKQVQVRHVPSKTGSSRQIHQGRNSQQSRPTPLKQSQNKPGNSKQPVNKQLAGKSTHNQKSHHPSFGNRLRNSGNSKKLLVSAHNKRKATSVPANIVKKAKIKKKESKAQAMKSALAAHDVRRRSTNSMRLRKLTSAGEVCHDDSSESMSESERLAEAIRRSKLETRMTTSEAKKAAMIGKLNRQERGKYLRKVKGKRVQQISSQAVNDKGKKDPRDITRRSYVGTKKNQHIRTDKEQFTSNLKTLQKKLKKATKARNSLPSMVVERPKLDARRSSTSHREAKTHLALKRSISTPSKVPTTLMGKIVPIQAPMIWKLVNSSQEKSSPVDLAKIQQNMKSNATLKFTGEQKVLIRFSQNNNNSNSTAVKTIIANVASPSKSPPKNATGVKTKQAVLMPMSIVNDSNGEERTDSSKDASGINRPVRLLRSTSKVTSNRPNYSIIPLSTLLSNSSTVSSIPHLLSMVQKNAIKTTLAPNAQQMIAVPSSTRICNVSTTISAGATPTTKTTATTAAIMNIASTATTPLKATIASAAAATAVKLLVVSSFSPSLTNSTPILVPAIQGSKTSFSGTVPAVSSVSQAESHLSRIASTSTKQAFLPQTSKTLIIKHSTSTPQVFTLIPASRQQHSGQLQFISPGQVIQKCQVPTSSPAKGSQQLIRPIFIAAQPSMLPSKPAGTISKVVSNTPTVTTQAIFIATAPIQPNGQQPTSTIKLTLPPNKSIFAGAIPLIFSPQAPASSSGSLSSQLQHALSSLQSQNLATVPTVSAQTPVVSAIQVPPQPLSEKQTLPTEVRPIVSIFPASNGSANVVTTGSQMPLDVSINLAAEQSRSTQENVTERRVLSSEPPSSEESEEFTSAKAKVANSKVPCKSSLEKSIHSTLNSTDEISSTSNSVCLPDPLNRAVATVAVDSGGTAMSSPVQDLPSLRHVLPSVQNISGQTCVGTPEIFEYLPTLPGACTSAVAKSRERLTVKIPFSKLARNTRSAYQSMPVPMTSSISHSSINDLADISQIMNHTAKIDLTFHKKVSDCSQQSVDSTASVLPDCNSANQTTTTAALSVGQSVQLSSLAKSAMQRFVEIRPATTAQSSTTSNVAPLVGSVPSVINTAAIRTPIVTPAVLSSSVIESENDPKSLPISIKLASVDSGVRLRNSKLVTTVPKSPQCSSSMRHFAAQPNQTPLLPRPTQGYVTVLTRKPVSTPAGQLSNAIPNQLPQFPVTYLANLPVQINNQPRPQVVIQPAPKPFLPGALHPSPTVSTNSVRFGNQTMVFPVSLSMPGLNLQQVPVTSNILLSSLCPIGSTSSLQQNHTQIRAAISTPPAQLVTAQNIAPVTKFQRLIPHTVTSIIARQSVVSSVTKSANLMTGNLITVSGGFPIQSNQEAPKVKFTAAAQAKPVISSVEKVLASTTLAIPTVSTVATASITAVGSLPVSTVAVVSPAIASTATSSLASHIETSPVKDRGLLDGSDSPSRDGIVGLTNSLKALLKTDITEGSTVTINIQGNPVTYALKDGKLFSMPHNFPAKTEKSSSDAERILSPQQNSSSPLLSVSSTLSVSTCDSTQSQSASNIVSCNDSIISIAKIASSASKFPQNDVSSPPRQLRVSVPRRLLHRKTFRSKSASTDASIHPLISSMSVTMTSSRLNSTISASSSVTQHCFENTKVISSGTNPISNYQTPSLAPAQPSLGTLTASTANSQTSCSTIGPLFRNGKPDLPPSGHFPHSKLPHATTEPQKRHDSSFSEDRNQTDDDTARKRVNSEPVDLKFGFECDFCSEKFESYNLMWRHRKLHLNETANFSGLRRMSAPRALCPKFIACDLCNKVFHSYSDLERHKQQDICTQKPDYTDVKAGNNETEPKSHVINGRQAWESSVADDINGLDLTFDLLTEDSSDIFQKDISPDFASSGNDVTTSANLGTFMGDSFTTNFRKKGPAVSELFSDIAGGMIGSIAPCTDSVNGKDTDVPNRHRNDNFDINANFDDQVFEDLVDVKPDIKPAKIRRTSAKSSIPRKRIFSRKNSQIGKNNANQKRNKRRSRVTISDDEETVDDDGLDLDGEFVTVGKLHGEFTCSRCDLGFQNETELDDHNESFHDSLRYNFRERRSVSNLEYLDEFEFDFE